MKTLSIKLIARWIEADFDARNGIVVRANLTDYNAEELLLELCSELGYKRVWELIEHDVRDATDRGEESWYAPQDPGHKRSAKWGGVK